MMFVQNDRALNPIGKWGCYFCSLGKIAETVLNLRLTPEQVMRVYAESVCSSIMEWNCYIKRPDSVLALFMYALGERGHLVKYIGWWNADMKTDQPELWGQWKPEDVTHEVTRFESGGGHHFRLPNWDPWPELKLGNITGRRLFHVELLEEVV